MTIEESRNLRNLIAQAEVERQRWHQRSAEPRFIVVSHKTHSLLKDGGIPDYDMERVMWRGLRVVVRDDMTTGDFRVLASLYD